ncbi:hypothetical protein CAPN006_20800 [Capnocytophaga canimorsus]|uniref:Rossmann-like and DUF2520 domain-containing protein n=1 Tax=Capnocytophaga canimorsus TaxID=28188 RepID=UPI001ACE9194|nr:Rossmann-like and DUF2520 domain-containing protein [Capnocytophaga canimorsus]GIM57688.1 hypothetical protein CAPN006_20800 [Capnocytophaga canimorsus]
MKTTKQITISIIGGGNVAFHLLNALYKKSEIVVKQIYNRSDFSSDFDIFPIEKINNLADLKPVDVCFIAVKDEAIVQIAQNIPFSDCLMVHTSGNTEMEILKGKNSIGVFYPLQSFSKSKSVDFKSIPICLEAECKTDLQLLEKIARLLSEKVYFMDSKQRKYLHVSAVFANNFTNYMLAVSQQICQQQHIPFEILSPLIEETFQKIKHIAPAQAQTGPARRDDKKTIHEHLQLLNASQGELYKQITNAILDDYGKEKL